MSALSNAWDQRSSRERAVLGWIVAIAVIALLVAFVWLPLERQRARLVEEMPRLRDSVAALEREADNVRKLKAMPVRAGTATPVAALAGAPPTLAGAQVAPLDDRRIRVTGADVGFAALIDWIGSVQASHGLRVDSARLEALPTAGRVRVELVMARS